MAPIRYKNFKIDLSNNFVQLFTVSYRNLAAQVCSFFRDMVRDPPEVCVPIVTQSLTEQYDGRPLGGTEYTLRVGRLSLPLPSLKVAFITAVYGGYDTACQPFAPQTRQADFICFSDDPAITSNSWEVDTTPYHLLHRSPLDNGALLNSMQNNNHTFNIAKYYKQAFLNIPRMEEYDIVVWLDGSLQLTEPRAAEQVSLVVAEGGCAMGVFNHTIRSALAEEVLVSKEFYRYCVTSFGGQAQPYQNISGQFADYVSDGDADTSTPGVNEVGVWYTTLMIYNMRDLWTRILLDRWYLETLRHSTNDQISFPHVVLKENALNALCTLPNEVIRGQYPNHQSSIYVKNDHTMPL